MAKHIQTYLNIENPKKRIFCFPFAGAGAAIYRLWTQLLPSDTALVAIELPGRVQLREKPAQDMKELIDVIYSEILPLLDLPFAFFGHSYGSVVAYELTRRLLEEKKALPDHLFVSSRRAPHIPPDSGRVFSHLSDSEFIREIQVSYGAIPAAVLNEQSLLNLFLPVLKEDIRVNEQYLGSIDPPLTIPVTFYYGSEDKSVSLSELEKWQEVTTGPFRLKTFPGGHFYIDTARESLIEDIVHNFG